MLGPVVFRGGLPSGHFEKAKSAANAVKDARQRKLVSIIKTPPFEAGESIINLSRKVFDL
jgi:hypothetical protein